MKNKLFFMCLLTTAVMFSTNAKAQMFYSSSYDKGVSKTEPAPEQKNTAVEPDPETDHIPAPVKERLRNDAVRILAKPDEVYCYGISRKSPKNKTDTIDGYALNGECGTLNDEGLKAVQDKIFDLTSFDMTTVKISAACVIKPKLLLRFRRGVDFVDAVLSGEKCPGIVYLYGGETKEFYARPMNEWLDTFILAVSNDLVPVGTDSDDVKNKQIFIRKKKADTEQNVGVLPKGVKQPAAQEESAEPAAPKTWGRRFN